MLGYNVTGNLLCIKNKYLKKSVNKTASGTEAAAISRASVYMQGIMSPQ
jgi:hypothetical protein